MARLSTIRDRRVTIVAFTLAVLGLYLTSLYSYLLFHSLAELFSIVIACSIFVVAWNSRQWANNNYFVFIGIAFLFVAALDLVHTLAYKDMGVFKGYGANLATQLWLATRYVLSLSLIIAPIFLRRKLPVSFLFLSYVIATTLLLTSIFYWGIFPQSFVEDMGLTAFKKTSEYAISAILGGSIVVLLRYRKEFDKGIFRLVIASIAVSMASELSFTLYTDAYGLLNMIGHLLEIASFYLIYKAFIETGLKKPYTLLFRHLKQSKDTLADQARQLERANAELIAVNKELETFSYSVSHDLRAPLTRIHGFTELLLEEYNDKMDESCKDYLRRVLASSQNMAQLMSGLLHMSRTTTREMQRERTDLSAMAREIATQLQSSQPERKVEFAIAPGITADGDPRLLQVALQNLLDNSWKFTAKLPEAKIEFGVRRDLQKNGLVYYVRDNGVGFDPSHADRLFIPFQHLHDRTEFPGSGIGLATVQRIVHRHGGRIWAEGAEGQGAMFSFTL